MLAFFMLVSLRVLSRATCRKTMLLSVHHIPSPPVDGTCHPTAAPHGEVGISPVETIP